MYQTDKCLVAQVLKVVVTINLIIIDHSRIIQAFRIIEISKYDDGGQLTTRGQLMQGSSTSTKAKTQIQLIYLKIPTQACIKERGINGLSINQGTRSIT